jgi:DNA (cytosine-5)-methyltransferase 1
MCKKKELEILKHKPQIGIFSFFSGAGFLDLGFEKTSPYEIMFVNEAHEPFLHVYKSSRKRSKLKEPKFDFHLADINQFLSEKSDLLGSYMLQAKSDKDLIGFIGGPPCPDFSIGGKNKGSKGDNGKLSQTYVNLIIQNTPDFFLFENVKGLYRTKKHREFFDDLKRILVKNGYFLTERLINAIEYGVPQDRERIILIGFHKNCLNYLNYSLNGDGTLESFDWYYKIKYSLPDIFSYKWPEKEPFVENKDIQCPKNIIKELTVQYWFDKNDVENHPNGVHCFKPKAGLEKFKLIDEGDDKKKSYKRLHRWRYSPTAAYGNNEVHLHPYKARRITVSEALAIQSLPKTFVIPDDTTLTNMFKTVGNGVPYLAAKGIAETIYNFINEHTSTRDGNA